MVIRHRFHPSLARMGDVSTQSAIRKIGNFSGIIIPKPMLAEMGMKPGNEVELTIQAGMLVVKPHHADPRADWADGARAIASSSDDQLVLGDSGNER